MIDLGFVRPGSTIRIPFDTFDGGTGASITMTGYVVCDIDIYKDGGTTERASTTGFTATTDFDGATGLHVIVIDLSSNATAGFFSAGSEYMVAVNAVTVDGQTVRFWAARFRIGWAHAIINTTIASLSSQTVFTLTAGPTEADALVGCPVVIWDVASNQQMATGIISAYAVTTRQVTLTTAPTFTIAATDNVAVFLPSNVRWIATAVPAVGTAHFGVNVVNAGGTAWGSGAITAASIATDAITAAKIAADAIGASELAACAIGSSELATTAVNEIRDSILSDATTFAGANIDAAISTRATPTQVNTEVDNALNTAIPACPTADSINERIATMDGTVACNLDAAISTRATPAQVNTEVSDVIKVDTYAEPAQGAPSTTPTLDAMIARLYFALINPIRVDTSGCTDHKEFYDNADANVLWKKVVTDAACIYTEDTGITGP